MAEQASEAERWLAAAGPVPEFIAAGSKPEWQEQRLRIRETLGSLLGQLPARPDRPLVKLVRREDRGGYVLEKFEFDNGAGAVVPGYLLLPKGAAKAPAILYCHWHGGQYDVGKEELFRTNATPVAPGPALVEQGYVVLAIDAYCFGERNGRGPGGFSEKGGAGEMTASKFNLWVGRTLWGMMVRDDLMALDYLVSRPEVDPSRIGVTGISMGSTRTWWVMAMDDRPRAAVGICCLTRYQDLILAGELRQHGIYYFVPGLLRHFDIEAVVALAAPRPMLFLSGEIDAGSPAEGIRTIESRVRPVYDLYGVADHFQSVLYPETGHVYTPEMWQRMVEWMGRYVRGG
ncbi:MAG: dienelactone hydrolase family protein [Verrucomicrobia bacterium]|nr:dienelactone hydrolase family protein [Verrucomicrobiota bacterium]